MVQDVWATLSWALGLGLDTQEINVWQMSLRALVVFGAAIGMIRLGNKRFMGQNTTFDAMLGIVFGSVVSRAITGNAPFFPTLAAALVLVLAHWLLAALAFRSHRVGTLVKGNDRILVRDGEILWDAMHHSHITEHDLHEAMRKRGKAPDVRQVQAAHLERNGDITIILREHQ